jgi:3-dehydroquinate dehydratase type I
MGTSLLCETVTGATMAELLAARDAARVGDMVELRLDGVADLDVAGALANRRSPVIVTCRPRWEGGTFTGSEDERRAILELALKCGAERVDVEFRAGFADLIRGNRARVVVSSHDFTGVPQDLAERARAMRATGAEVIKVAVTAARLTDTLPLLDIARDGNAVVIGMGDAGIRRHWHGRRGHPEPPTRHEVRIAVDVCRKRRGARADSRAAHGGPVPLPRDWRKD